MTREELNAIRGYVSNIQAIKDAHNINKLPINYGTICTITANGWKLIKELKALDQEHCDYAISCDIAVANVQELVKLHPNDADNLNRVIKCLKTLPPVYPKPKTGHWIYLKHNKAKCSECDDIVLIAQTYGNANYCPNCGIKMIEPQIESEESWKIEK